MLPIPGLDPGTVDPSEAAFASGMLAGAGLREISQTLGLSRKRGGAGSKPGGGAMPSAATMAQGNLGDLDKVMLLSRLQAMAGGGGPMAGPPMDPMAAMPGAGAMPPPMPGAGPMGPAGPLPPVGMPPLPLPVGALPIGPPPMTPQPPLGNPGGALPLQMLLQMLSGTQGMV